LGLIAYGLARTLALDFHHSPSLRGSVPGNEVF